MSFNRRCMNGIVPDPFLLSLFVIRIRHRPTGLEMGLFCDVIYSELCRVGCTSVRRYVAHNRAAVNRSSSTIRTGTVQRQPSTTSSLRWSRRTLLLVRLFRLLVLPPRCWTSSAAPLPRELLPAMSGDDEGQAAALRQPNTQIRDGGTMVITTGLRAIGARAATIVTGVVTMIIIVTGGTENT
jgi:hypothetical protein